MTRKKILKNVVMLFVFWMMLASNWLPILRIPLYILYGLQMINDIGRVFNRKNLSITSYSKVILNAAIITTCACYTLLPLYYLPLIAFLGLLECLLILKQQSPEIKEVAINQNIDWGQIPGYKKTSNQQQRNNSLLYKKEIF